MPRIDLIQDRRDTSTNWESVNPTLAAGEHGYETDTGMFKIGDGTSAWADLSYAAATPAQLAGKMAKAANLGDVADAETAIGNLGAVPAAGAQAGSVEAPTDTVLFSFQPVDPAKAPFNLTFGGGSFSGTWDTVMYFGYNADQADAGEPSARFAVEQDYLFGGQHLMEGYLEFALAGGGTSVRPYSATFNRSTGESTAIIASQGVSSFISIDPNETQTVKFNATSTGVAGDVPFVWTTAGAKSLLKAVNEAGNATATIISQAADNVIIIGDGNAGRVETIRVKGTTGVQIQSGNTKRFEVDATGIGFFNATPAAKPTGVAVSAAGIHAALVTLGLIAA